MTTKTAGAKVQGAETQTTKAGHAEVSATEKLSVLAIDDLMTDKGKEGKEIIPSQRKMNVGEKIDAMKKLERLTLKLGHLQKSREDIEVFGAGKIGLDGASLYLVDSEDNQVPIKNAEVVKEIIGIAKMKVQEGIILTEKEIEAFVIS